MSSGLHVIHVMLSLDVGGLERNVLNQVRYAPQLQQRTAIICLEHPGTLAPQVEALGVKIYCLHKKPGIRLGLFGQLQSLLVKLAPDVVHTHQIGTLFYAGRAARRAGVPLVAHTEHGQERYAQSRRKRLLGRLAGRSTHLFFCLTQDMVNAVKKHRIVPESKIRLIHNGIDTQQYATRVDTTAIRAALEIPEGAPVIGTVGRLTEIKRQDVLIRAFAALNHPSAHLLLVGGGPLQGDIQSLAQTLGIGSRVHFAGYQSQTAAFVQMMDVFALTSRSEGMPQAAIEASVAGIPVIASDVGGLPELIENGQTGILFPVGDHAALAMHLARLLQNPREARQLGNAGRERAIARFDISRMAKDYERYFIAALSQLGRHGVESLGQPSDITVAGHRWENVEQDRNAGASLSSVKVRP